MQRYSLNRNLITSSYDENDLREQYKIMRTLGRGSLGEVKLAEHLSTQTKVAIKILHKCKRDPHHKSEVEIMKDLDHPYVIKMFQVIETTYNTYMVLEHVAGGDLMRRIEKEGHLKEEVSRRVFKQLVCALHYCHGNGIAHWDIKPENILLDEHDNVKLSDFGLSVKLTYRQQRLASFCGTFSYCAPEVFEGNGYDSFAIDTWSSGVVLYYMSTGYLPFRGYTYEGIKQSVLKGKYITEFKLSPDLWEVITKSLTVDPRKRPTIGDIMNFAWLENNDGCSLSLAEENSDSQLDPIVMVIMNDMGYNSEDIKEALQKKNFDDTMATYLLLRQKSPWKDTLMKTVMPWEPGENLNLVEPPSFQLGLQKASSALTGPIILPTQSELLGDEKKIGRSPNIPCLHHTYKTSMQYGLDTQCMSISISGEMGRRSICGEMGSTTSECTPSAISKQSSQDVATADTDSLNSMSPQDMSP
ncbi:sperm motility kinase-like [Nannospalax galili]|uniref:sperm motility kinase-like n=1 Tax=Nannospalax galili TaxID=1026970 RepID=UPI0004ED2649|nr:sperm motility kinase-like [Nannospalax galili]